MKPLDELQVRQANGPALRTVGGERQPGYLREIYPLEG